MKKTYEFLVPDYYPKFRCKMGECRRACCEGWPVTISRADYFRLVGISCGADLRRRLDAALHILSNPTPEEYAEISPRYDGTCPLRLEDGRCALHAELGEEALSMVCRLFPRGFRIRGAFESSCTNSCEAVPEMLMNHPEPLRFVKIPITIDLPPAAERKNEFATGGREQEIRLYYIRIIQNRELSLPDRLMTLRTAMLDMEQALRGGDAERVGALLAALPKRFAGTSSKPGQADLDFGMPIAKAMVEQVDRRSRSVRQYGEETLEWFAREDNRIERYREAIANYERIVPNRETILEHLLVNHMFFEQFPFQDRPVPVIDEFAAICAVYTLLRFLTIGWMAIHPSQTDFIDVCAAVFRLVSHTDFDRFAAELLKELDCATPERIYSLIRL